MVIGMRIIGLLSVSTAPQRTCNEQNAEQRGAQADGDADAE
jgi:hypothetical protein